jgi:stage III sporulation protein AG
MNIEELLNNLKEKLSVNKKLVIIMIIGLLGILLIALSGVGSDSTQTAQEQETASVQYSQEEYIQNLEARLEDLISSIENTGCVKVMITLESTSENVFAVEENIKKDDKSSSYQSKYVIIDNKNAKEGISLKTNEPKVRGVAVVCTGGGNPAVAQQVTQTVCTVLGIGSNRVSVTKMK